MKWLAPAAAWLATGGAAVGLAFAHLDSDNVVAVFVVGAVMSTATTMLAAFGD